MFDKIILKARIDTDDIDTIVLRNYLQQCVEGDEIYYKSTSYSNFDGCDILIRGDTLRCKCSVHKLYCRGQTGRLDNSRPMTFAMAVRTILELLNRLCVKAENAVVTYYEVGITMKLSLPANEYIKLVDECSSRQMWNDANFPEFRQKTTEKSRHYRKFFKIYDKSHEFREKGRRVGDNILRIETVYRHQNIPLPALLDNVSLSRIGRKFYDDWSSLAFARGLSARKGMRLSQLERAREISRLGVTQYKERYRAMYLEGRLTKKQWETIRNFARSWPAEKANYVEEISPLEAEFKDRLLHGYQTGRVTPFKKNM